MPEEQTLPKKPRRRKIRREDTLHFASVMLSLVKHVPDPAYEDMTTITHCNCHGLPYLEDHFVGAFENMYFQAQEDTIRTIIQASEHACGLKVNTRIVPRGVFFMRTAFTHLLGDGSGEMSDTPPSAFDPAYVAATLITDVYLPWFRYHANDWAAKMGHEYYEENGVKVLPGQEYAVL